MDIDPKQHKKLVDACKRFGIRELYAFGSLASGNLKPESDVDFLVDFQREGFAGSFDQYMDFKSELEMIMGRPVDLVSRKKIRNPLFRDEVEKNKAFIYAA